MSQSCSHRITVCTSCRHKDKTNRPGYELIAQLRAALAAAGDDLPASFDIAEVACMAGCSRPCTVAYHGKNKATYLFGDIEPDHDIADLITFAQQYATLDDGWCSSLDRPGKLRKSTLARIPAAFQALQDSLEKAS
ncbi:DUF1636 domain-containing protein [Roseovarius sp. EL26]|uniref:DUF1636 family protein n=1 Tax=Roseovarius sp. EL26 TaxID=2126672 RepID=UPI000EA1049C|nr:DUF1636 domain-containing protein [Roseovarius sp. EL26]